MDVEDVVFFGELWIRRQALAAAFDAAMEYHLHQHRTDMELLTAAFNAETAEKFYDGLQDEPPDTTGLQLAEDSLSASADIFAGAVILIFDDVLHRYASMVGITQRGIALSYGPVINGVHLTTLIAAGSNNFRHAREWAELPRPYPTDQQATERQRLQLASIRPLMQALSLRDRINGYVTRHVLVKLAGNVGTGTPSYAVVEDLILDAAAEMARATGCLPGFTEARARLLFRP